MELQEEDAQEWIDVDDIKDEDEAQDRETDDDIRYNAEERDFEEQI
jgi:hypothetical protein